MTFDRKQIQKSLTRARLAAILEKFFTAPPEILSYRANNRGKTNLVYFLATNDKPLILHILNPSTNMGFTRTQEDLDYTISFENAVRARGVPLAYRYPGPTERGYVVERPGKTDYFVTLHDFVPGRHHRNLDMEKLRALGATVARMHLAVENFSPTALPSRSWSVSELPEQFFERQQKGHLNPNLESYLAEWDATGKEARRFIVERARGLAKYPVHQDINGANLIYQDNRLQAIIDFDNSHDDYLFEDLVTPLLNHCGFTSSKLTSEATYHFLDSYTQYRSFPGLELELCLYAWLAFQAWYGATTLANKLEDRAYTPNNLESLAKRTQARVQNIQQMLRKPV